MDSRKCGIADTSDGNDSFGYIQSHRDERQEKKRTKKLKEESIKFFESNPCFCLCSCFSREPACQLCLWSQGCRNVWIQRRSELPNFSRVCINMMRLELGGRFLKMEKKKIHKSKTCQLAVVFFFFCKKHRKLMSVVPNSDANWFNFLHMVSHKLPKAKGAWVEEETERKGCKNKSNSKQEEQTAHLS